MRKITQIFIHHSASPWGNAQVIEDDHKQRGWRDIGYHFVILNGITTYDDYRDDRHFESLIGSIETGRTLDADPWLEAGEVGAHVYGFNRDSVGICLIHDDEEPYDSKMIYSLRRLVLELVETFDISVNDVKGHSEVDSKKPLCPGINMPAFRELLIDNGTSDYGAENTLVKRVGRIA